MILDKLDYLFFKGFKDENITLFLISSCPFCEDVKTELEKLNYSFYYVYVDFFDSEILYKIKKSLVKKTKIKNFGLPVLKINQSFFVNFEIEDLQDLIENKKK